jgi:AcrR family transcriptional regulator
MVPVETVKRPTAWAGLDWDEKRERVLDVATGVFTREGLEAPMPRVARAAGIGVGSLYRCYRSKEDLIAAIVVEQMDVLRAEVSSVHEDEDAGRALERSIRQIAERQASNKLVRAALAATSDRREVKLAVGEVSLAWQELLDRARGQGSVRGDATVTDLRLIFAAARAADEVEPGARERMLELMLDAMRGTGATGNGVVRPSR